MTKRQRYAPDPRKVGVSIKGEGRISEERRTAIERYSTPENWESRESGLKGECWSHEERGSTEKSSKTGRIRLSAFRKTAPDVTG